jgi:hypothetical protein
MSTKKKMWEKRGRIQALRKLNRILLSLPWRHLALGKLRKHRHGLVLEDLWPSVVKGHEQ